MQHTGTFLRKIVLFSIFRFSRFSAKQDVFCFCQLKKKRFSSIMRITSGIFWHCRYDEFSTMVFFCIFRNLCRTLSGCRLGPFPASLDWLLLWFLVRLIVSPVIKVLAHECSSSSDNQVFLQITISRSFLSVMLVMNFDMSKFSCFLSLKSQFLSNVISFLQCFPGF